MDFVLYPDIYAFINHEIDEMEGDISFHLCVLFIIFDELK